MKKSTIVRRIMWSSSLPKTTVQKQSLQHAEVVCHGNTRKGILMYVLPEIPAATTAELSLLTSWKSIAVMSGEKFSIRTIM